MCLTLMWSVLTCCKGYDATTTDSKGVNNTKKPLRALHFEKPYALIHMYYKCLLQGPLQLIYVCR